VASDIGIDAVKIGMIGSAATVEAVADRIEQPDLANVPVVFDPVMIATSGSRLADEATIAAFGRLLRRATVSTPNLDELAALGGKPLTHDHDIAMAADRLIAGGSGAILATGASSGDALRDVLFQPREAAQSWEAGRINTIHDHGTGCTLASGIATGLAQGMSLPDAIGRAREFVRAALFAAPGLGQGHGPMGHRAL